MNESGETYRNLKVTKLGATLQFPYLLVLFTSSDLFGNPQQIQHEDILQGRDTIALEAAGFAAVTGFHLDVE